jgi:hypothetical protein
VRDGQQQGEILGYVLHRRRSLGKVVAASRATNERRKRVRVDATKEQLGEGAQTQLTGVPRRARDLSGFRTMVFPISCGLNHSFTAELLPRALKNRRSVDIDIVTPRTSGMLTCFTKNPLLRVSFSQYCQLHSLRKFNHKTIFSSLI